MKETKCVVAGLIKDAEEKGVNIVWLQKETLQLRAEVETIKEEIKKEKTDCEISQMKEKCDSCKSIQNLKTKSGKHDKKIPSNMSNFRFVFSNEQNLTQQQD